MRLETIPLLLGVVVGLLGVFLLADAWLPDDVFVAVERRRRTRAERHRLGEAFLGLGVLCMAASLLGRDNWRFAPTAVVAGAVLMIIGIVLNRRFLREVLVFRGAARRGEGHERIPAGTSAPAASDATQPDRRDRIR